MVTLAAAIVGVDRSLHYRWLGNADYRARFEDACEQAADLAEQEARRRAIDGWEEPVFGRLPGAAAGEGVIGHVRRYSDRLLALLLRGRRPQIFSRRVAVAGDAEAPPTATGSVDLSALTALERSTLDELLAKALHGGVA